MKKRKESSFLLSTRVSLSFALLSLHAAYASQTAYVTHWIFRAPAHFNSMLITVDLLFALQQSFKTLSASTSSSERAKGLLLSLDRVTHPLQLWATCVVIVLNILQYCTMGIQGKERQCFAIGSKTSLSHSVWNIWFYAGRHLKNPRNTCYLFLWTTNMPVVTIRRQKCDKSRVKIRVLYWWSFWIKSLSVTIKMKASTFTWQCSCSMLFFTA